MVIGRVASGAVRPGMALTIAPPGVTTEAVSIEKSEEKRTRNMLSLGVAQQSRWCLKCHFVQVTLIRLRHYAALFYLTGVLLLLAEDTSQK